MMARRAECPDYMERVARVSERWSLGGSAKVELRDFTRRERGPDDRGQNSAGGAAAEGGDGDFLRAVAEAVLQLLMETDVEGLIGAGRHERSGDG